MQANIVSVYYIGHNIDLFYDSSEGVLCEYFH